MQMGNLNKEDFIQVLRRQSGSFPRGSSKYRGVILRKSGKWEARMGQILGKKYVSAISFQWILWFKFLDFDKGFVLLNGNSWC